MGSKKVKVFIQNGCPKCPEAKKLAEKIKDRVEVILYNTETSNGLAEASYYQIMTTPAFLIVNGLDEPIKFWPKTPNKKEILEVIK